MWDIVEGFLNSLGFTALGGFLKFYRNRENLIKTFSDEKKTLANIGRFQAHLFEKYTKHTDPLIKDLITFGPEYLAYVVPDEAIAQVQEYFIELGRTLEIKRQMKHDKVLQKVADYGGELRKIARL